MPMIEKNIDVEIKKNINWRVSTNVIIQKIILEKVQKYMICPRVQPTRKLVKIIAIKSAYKLKKMESLPNM